MESKTLKINHSDKVLTLTFEPSCEEFDLCIEYESKLKRLCNLFFKNEIYGDEFELTEESRKRIKEFIKKCLHNKKAWRKKRLSDNSFLFLRCGCGCHGITLDRFDNDVFIMVWECSWGKNNSLNNFDALKRFFLEIFGKKSNIVKDQICLRYNDASQLIDFI